MGVKADWSQLLDKVARGQSVVGKDKAVPMLVGPCTLVSVSRGSFNRSAFIAKLLPAYAQALAQLKAMGVPEVQIHEPILALGATAKSLRADCEAAFATLNAAAAGLPLHLVVPYDDVDEEVYTWLVQLPVAAIGLDFCGVPGAAHGNLTAQLIAKHGFPKVSHRPWSP